MTPLADALVAAQRRAIATAERQFVAGQLEAEDLRDVLVRIGLADTLEGDQLVESLTIIRDYGAQAPGEPRSNGASDEPKKATPNQRSYIVDLLRKGEFPPFAEHDLLNLSHDQASEIISALRNGTYDPAKYDVPF